jgi:hypothetical protein
VLGTFGKFVFWGPEVAADSEAAGLGVRKWVRRGRGLKVGSRLGTFRNFVFSGPEVVAGMGVWRWGGVVGRKGHRGSGGAMKVVGRKG